ncbi:MAG TPA: hypothetical protein VMF30_01820 [Pirellulales bacterium]|nr:hypothetical protein [Pirellulales bacterium]
MMKHIAVVGGALLAVSLLGGRADAQALGYGGGGHSLGRPTVSPYLNLIFSDAMASTVGTAGGYQTLVRPFVDGRRAVNANSAAISQLQQSQGAFGGAAGGGGSGGAARYMNYSHYYPGLGGGY